MVAKRFSAKYKKGFREGFNNPSRFSKINLSARSDDMIKGIVSGVIEKQNHPGKFIWNPTDLKKYLK